MSENFESPKLRCLVDVQRDNRGDCKPYDSHPTYKEPRRENEGIKELKASLIRLGYSLPALRPHLRRILDHLSD